VEEHQVRVERYLSEGGYAHVYLTQSEKAIYPPKKGEKWDQGFKQHCLKRIAFEDDSVWTDVKKEIEVMVSNFSLCHAKNAGANEIESVTAKSAFGSIPWIKPYQNIKRRS